MPRAIKVEKRASRWPARAALLGIALAAYGNSFFLGLAQDSKVMLAQDPRIRAVTAENLGQILTRNYWWPLGGDGLYRPVTTLSFLFNYAVLGNGRDAAGYHVVNFLLHAINVWLLYELALLIFRRTGPAFFAAAIWAVHPVGTEAVTGVAGRADLLAAVSVLGGVLLYARARGRWTPAALFVVATLGVFAKENAAVLIGLMFLWEISFGESKAGVVRRWRSYAAVAASLAVLAIVRYAVFTKLAPASPIYVDNPLRLASFWAARWTAVKIVCLDLKLLVLPITLVCDHSFDAVPLASWRDPGAWVSLLMVLAILAAVVLRYRRDRVAFWAAGFFAIALLPTSNLLFPIGAAFAERFLYLPSVGFAILVAALYFRLANERVTQGVLIAIVVLFGIRTVARNPAWDDDLSLASADLANAPRSFRLHYMLARALAAQDAPGDLDKAIAEDEAACRILAPLQPARSISFPPTDLGRFYREKADLVPPDQRTAWLDRSLTMLLRAREISRAVERDYDDLQRARGPLLARSGDQQLYLYLADTEIKLGKYADAVESLRYAQGLNPRTLPVYDGLAVAYSKMGDPARAVVSMEEKGAIDNFPFDTLRAIRELYSRTPDRDCAFAESAAGWQWNLAGCPQVKVDLCAAYGELVQAYRDARVPAGVEWAMTSGRQRYGCAVQ